MPATYLRTYKMTAFFLFAANLWCEQCITTDEGNKKLLSPPIKWPCVCYITATQFVMVTPFVFFFLVFFSVCLSFSLSFTYSLSFSFSHLDSRHFIIHIAWSRHGKACISLNVGAWVELSFTTGSGQSDIPQKREHGVVMHGIRRGVAWGWGLGAWGWGMGGEESGEAHLTKSGEEHAKGRSHHFYHPTGPCQ